ncbi:MAG: TSUP family transporter [Spirochaetaceae bacterium]|nr:TSUP family transporter [Spirochaetaceae bacterium]
MITGLIMAATGFLAGFVDSIAGGGGIITVPVLLALGLPPHLALGTNKLQASFGSITSTVRYYRKKLFTLRETWPGIVFTLIGAAIGTILIQLINADLLMKAIPVFLLAVFLYTLFSPQLGATDRQVNMSKILFFPLAGILLGFYDGFFGPGTGSFWTIALVVLYGLNLKKATGTTKVMNFTSNIVSLVVFLIGGKVVFMAGLVMGSGQILGAWAGSHMVIKHSTKFIRIFFLIVVGATIAKILWSEFF